MQGLFCGQEAALLISQDPGPLFLEELEKPEEILRFCGFRRAVSRRSSACEVIEGNQPVYGVPNETEVGAAWPGSCQALIKREVATCYGTHACGILAPFQEGGPLGVAIPELTLPRRMSSEELYEGAPRCLRYVDEEEGVGVP